MGNIVCYHANILVSPDRTRWGFFKYGAWGSLADEDYHADPAHRPQNPAAFRTDQSLHGWCGEADEQDECHSELFPMISLITSRTNSCLPGCFTYFLSLHLTSLDPSVLCLSRLCILEVDGSILRP